MNRVRYISFIFVCLLPVYGQSHPGVGIVMDSKGNVFYTDLTQVWKINTRGTKSVVVRNVHTHELFMDADDNLYGEHLWYDEHSSAKWEHYVWRLSAEGKLEKIIPDTKGFREKYSFVRDDQGNMYWADRQSDCQKVICKDKLGAETVLSKGCLKNIRWMYSTPSGEVYLMDGFDLKKIDTQGNISVMAHHLQENTKSGFKDNDPHLVMGLHANRQGEVMVAVYGGGKVKRVGPAKSVSTIAETNLQWLPTGVLSAPNGDLWILECSPANAVRVERFTKNNQRMVY